ncbi:16S rRNA (cytosine(1402)-N(4))-methyltransferase RsmH [Gemmata sp. G18]|uniref:Ribosomal RNA small subunit methyltransferase H n=1 Tax=Gemmata palustris TaxID=2822762 RepID=A0ABS5BYD1_9BACT|nr:16S rRNA (cytosine(1402)-N(4))-methyltransferase RsmH [Gemmata palustris]MBP3958747.1 16S rRNA (cytosine(1402)-N(4))-methyltransferase RsmH [Gemmata palustris]
MSATRAPAHVSVLPAETLALLDPREGQTWVDCTVGGGGHTRMLAERVGPTGRVIGLDQDPTMLEMARARLEGSPVELVHANFDQLGEVLAARGIKQIDGVFADLGFSSDQLGEKSRGLSFREDGPLDMRLDPTAGATAADMVNTMSEAGLADTFWEFGEERHSRRVAKRIVERRGHQPFATTADLASVVRSCVPRSGSIDPATRVFQALRIAVNDELGVLDRLLALLPRVVKGGGAAGIISFHSLEDRRVKQTFREPTAWQQVTKKPVEAGDEETARNPRARSAKLRVARRIGA